jgi:adenosylhomocysteine nucleosidase
MESDWKMLAVIVAMSEELKDIHRRMVVENTDKSGDMLVYRGRYKGKSLLLVKTGVGKQKAQVASRYLLSHYPITTMISTGFAGALKPQLKIGDVVVYSRILCADRLSTEPYSPDPQLLSMAKACTAVEYRCGTGITGLNLVASEWEKKKLGEETSSDVVDMESYWIARIADEYRVPLIIVRAISDTLIDSLPDLPSWRRRDVIPYFLTHPGTGYSLYRALLHARKNIYSFVDYMISAVG